MLDPYTDLEINCRSQLSILEACRHRQPGSPNRLREHAPDLRPAAAAARSTRSTRSRPVDVNGINKTAGEWYHLLYGEVYGLRVTRPAPDEHLRPADAREGRAPDVPRLLVPRSRCTARDLEVFGDGHQRRDFNYVDDAVARVPARGDARRGARAGLQPRRRRVRRVLRELAETARRARTASGSCELVPFPPDRKAIDIGDFYADYAEIERDLGWAPTVELREGLAADARLLPRARRRHYWDETS